MLPIVKNTNVIAPGMYKVHTKPNQTRTPQLHQDIRKPNKRVSFSTGVIPTTSVSRPQLKSNQLEDRVMPNNSQGKKQNVEDHRRHFKFSNNKTSVTACNDSLNAKTLNVNFVCVTCGKCVLNDNHDLCVLHYINGVNSRTRQPMAVPISTREPKQNVNQSVATSSKKTVATDSTVKKSRNITRKLYEQVSKTCSWWYPKYTPPGYNWKPKSQKGNVNPNLVEIVLFIVDSGCSKHMTGNLKLLTNFVEKFLGTVKFGNDQIAPILGYGDLVQGTITIKRVYYVEGLNHNLFSVGQFCDADLEVAFRKSTCYIRDLKGNDLLTGSRGTDLYSISLQDSTSPNPICLMAKATSSQAWKNIHQFDRLEWQSGGIKFLVVDKFSQLVIQKEGAPQCLQQKMNYVVSLSGSGAQVLMGLRTQLIDYGFHFDKIPMYCDSKAPIAISCNPVQHSHTKYIDVRYHFIKEQVEKGIVELFFVRTEYQLAELFTKALSEDRFKYLVR
ncbi:hypothetical protein Tco_0290549 [Tanacetum coccineum]